MNHNINIQILEHWAFLVYRQKLVNKSYISCNISWGKNLATAERGCWLQDQAAVLQIQPSLLGIYEIRAFWSERNSIFLYIFLRFWNFFIKMSCRWNSCNRSPYSDDIALFRPLSDGLFRFFLCFFNRVFLPEVFNFKKNIDSFLQSQNHKRQFQ